MRLVPTSYELIGRILNTDIYNEKGTLLLGAGKMLTVKDIDSLLINNIFEIAIKGPTRTARPIENIAPELLHQIDEAWSYEPDMAVIYKETLSSMKDLLNDAQYGNPINVQEIVNQFSTLIKHALEHRYVFHPLHTLKGKDEYTYRHSINVGLLSALIARLLGLPDEVCLEVGEAGLFHDIGKLEMPDEILNKPSELNDKEREVMRQHPQYGYAMLRKIPNIPRSFADVALLHHERLDGSGYPFGLKHENIPLSVQIVSVADKFDALASDRVYRAKLSPFEAAAALWDAQFAGLMNPAIVTPFVMYILESYIGSRVRLSNGQEGVIVRYNQQEPLRPLVRTDDDTFVKLDSERDVQVAEIL
ncbi:MULTISPECIES: HD-GYP domain-containing protein [Aneurinibacillus]|jgi:putative nucleotidyltransferase with HDIG domain|uniref:HD family phosphohydrolase n=1 Tax=Aneurinibacillus danicus TaxID=267746 RepID=A0A511VAS7_9BACL|nr:MULTISPECIES: HD-GYP domain-containing protein [Aneurinibacillus]GEN36030.1 HD family phosphohydrolase [Aneurinibacillus danicus]